MNRYDKIIIGAGLYGLYAADFCGRRGERVLVIECDSAAFKRATFVNQARVHMGYHYPRSYSTAIKSATYFERFNEDFGFCINSKFDKVYATSSEFSWTSAEQFIKFCADARIPCDYISPNKYFTRGLCDGAFLTKEYTYDAKILCKHFIDKINDYKDVEIRYDSFIESVNIIDDQYNITLNDGREYRTKFVLNATYASVNQILHKFDFNPLKIKYELCEIILCNVNDKFKNTGITVMDGPFFSIMPFGKTGLHSLTSVTFTPHMTCYNALPTFECQKYSNGYCTEYKMGNCNECIARPSTAWDYMSKLAKKYLNDNYTFSFVDTLFSMKPILLASEIDDSRPTVINKYSDSPVFVSVLSGKINTVYDLDEVL